MKTDESFVLRSIEVEGYRSLRSVRLSLGACTVVQGANGTGKSNLYRSLGFLIAAAQGRLARTIAEEGGMPSVLWAGERGKDPLRLRIAIELGALSYEMALGVPQTSAALTRFVLDPEVKTEQLRVRSGKRSFPLFERGHLSATARDASGERVSFPTVFAPAESVLSQIAEPHRFPELSSLKVVLSAWRCYHQFRTDAEAPMRRAQVSIRTGALASDGHDLAAVLQTIRESAWDKALDEAVTRAFPGARLLIEGDDAMLSVALAMPGMLRPLRAAELSDGTLRYLCLLAALLSPKPPPFLALNEPEGSLHPALYEPLAELIVDASKRSQVWVTTHAEALAKALEASGKSAVFRLAKEGGATVVSGDEGREG